MERVSFHRRHESLSSFGEDPFQPVSGLLDSIRSFDYAELHFGR